MDCAGITDHQQQLARLAAVHQCQEHIGHMLMKSQKMFVGRMSTMLMTNDVSDDAAYWMCWFLTDGLNILVTLGKRLITGLIAGGIGVRQGRQT